MYNKGNRAAAAKPLPTEALVGDAVTVGVNLAVPLVADPSTGAIVQPEYSAAAAAAGLEDNMDKGKRLTEERKQKLNELGFVWSLRSKRIDDHWDEMFRQLVDYKKVHGDCLVPSRFESNLKLGKVSILFFEGCYVNLEKRSSSDINSSPTFFKTHTVGRNSTVRTYQVATNGEGRFCRFQA